MAGSTLNWLPRPQVAAPSQRSCRIAGEVAGRHFLTLFDSGADVSVISSDIVQLLPCVDMFKPSDCSLAAVNKSKINVLYVAFIPLAFGDSFVCKHRFYVTDSIEKDVIVGNDFMCTYGVTLNFDTFSVSMRNSLSAFPMVGSNSNGVNAVQATTPLDDSQFRQVHQLLANYKQLYDGKPGLTSAAVHRIETGTANPVKAYRRPFSPSEIAEVDKQLDEMLANGIVQPSNSSWSSPVILVNKADGTKRFAIDYRRLNAVTRRDLSPLPLQTEFLDRLGQAKFFTTLDLKSGYWQIPVHPADRAKTAFVTHRGLFEFLVMPFGLMNAPGSFQNMMNTVLADLIYRRNVLVYVDDIIIWSNSFEEHLQLLDEVFSRLRKAGLKLNLKKCKFLTQQVKFLGHIVNANGILPDPKKVESLVNFPAPKSAAELRRFYGMASYLRRHVSNFARITAPLCGLLNAPDASFNWSDAHNQAFLELRSAIANAVQLIHPRFDRPFRIAADASDLAVGCMLSQIDDNGVDCPIAFASRKLLPAETRYPTTEKEALALVYATQQFRHYILGSEITLLSDHKPLLGLRTSPRLNARMQRWVIWLEQFNFNVEYVPGKTQVVADALSRAVSDFDTQFDDLAFPPIIRRIDLSADCRLEDATIRQLQLQDAVFGSVLQQLAANRHQQPTGTTPEARRLAAKFKRIREVGGVFYLHDHNRNLLLVPESLRSEVLFFSHSCTMSSHLGIKATLERLQSTYYWPTMGNDTRRFVLACEACGQAKPQNCQTTAPLNPLAASRPLEFVAMDVVSLPYTPRGNVGCLVITDLFTKWAEAYPLRSQTAEDVYPLVLDFVARYGIPDNILTDQGGEFENELLEKLYQQLGLRKIRTAAYHPQTDGQAERFNRCLIQMLRATTTDRNVHWDEVLAPVLFAYRSAVNSSTGFSPYEMLYGRAPKLPGHLVLGEFLGSRKLPAAHVTSLQAVLRKEWEMANRHLDAARAKQKKFFDRFTAERRFNVGDLVWLATPPRTQKLLPRYHGPFCVVKRFDNNVNYRIRNAEGTATYVVNIDRLKPCGQFEQWMERTAPQPVNNQPFQPQPVALAPPARQTARHDNVQQPTRVMTRPSRQTYRPGLVDTESALKHFK